MKKLFVFSIILKLFLTSILFADTTYLSGDVSGVWEASGSPYLVTGEIHVPTDSSLRIMPGCSVIFQGRYKLSIDNNAVFKAIGNAVDSIIFTPADTIITDSTGGHGGIEFNYAAEGCSLVYCKIEYGVTPVGGAIFCEWSNIYIINCTIINNTAWVLGGGLYFMTYNSVIIGNLVMNNKTCWLDGGGLYLYGGYPSPEPIFVRNQVTLVNNIIIFNKSAGCGGGVFCGGGDLSIINNTIINNSADSLGGGLFSWDYNS
ncbi:hypothetical protein JXI42_09630, partial [bacterium]|nr:hypothetical protein [bacterium]